MKQKTITFKYYGNNNDCQKYRCLKVTNSIRYFPNEYYTEEDVQKLCDSELWTVTIV